MILSKSVIKRWARVGPRATFGLTALELAKDVEDLMIVTADVSTSAGLNRFKTTYPGKYCDVGIAEQNLIGVASGLASEGFRVLTTTFAPFQTLRCCEQIKVNLGYMRFDVSMIGLASGVVLGTLGYTHCCIEDVGVMRCIPGMTIVSPADCGEVAKAIFAAVKHSGPVYVRLTGAADMPIIYTDDYDFVLGKGVVLREGSDAIIIGTGSMVAEAMEAASELENRGIQVGVVNMHTIKPLDVRLLDDICSQTNYIITVEEHSLVGGLGSAVAEHLVTRNDRPQQLILGLPDAYDHGGTYRDMLARHRLIGKYISEDVEKMVQPKHSSNVVN